jgi:predicted component of type VI protein secretion system
MDLVLRVVDGPSDGGWRGLEARFDASGGLIGRAETARLSLPDTSRTVSRFHAHVSCSGDTFYLEEMGSRNAAVINGKALKAGAKQALRPGDKVKIGHFLLAVDFDDPDFPATQVIDRRLLRLEAGADDDSTHLVVREGGAYAQSSNTELMDSFLDGAGIHLSGVDGLKPDFMKTLGLMLRALVGGMHRLSSQRMRFRDEPLADKSDPKARRVDPIRAAAEEARLLTTLLKPGSTGSDQPHTRVQEMVEELIARIAAMHTAVDIALEQTEATLSPSAVEERLQASLFLDELLPMRRKARLWELYERTHAGKAEGKGDARGTGARQVFNHAFTRAYEAEMSRLRRGESA